MLERNGGAGRRGRQHQRRGPVAEVRHRLRQAQHPQRAEDADPIGVPAAGDAAGDRQHESDVDRHEPDLGGGEAGVDPERLHHEAHRRVAELEDQDEQQHRHDPRAAQQLHQRAEHRARASSSGSARSRRRLPAARRRRRADAAHASAPSSHASRRAAIASAAAQKPGTRADQRATLSISHKRAQREARQRGEGERRARERGELGGHVRGAHDDRLLARRGEAQRGEPEEDDGGDRESAVPAEPVGRHQHETRRQHADAVEPDPDAVGEPELVLRQELDRVAVDRDVVGRRQRVKTPIASQTSGPKPAWTAKNSITAPIATSTAAIQRRW